jgi:hypothetical protein
MGKDSVERPRHAIEIERIDEVAGVPDFAAPAAAHEPPKLLLGGAVAPLRHLLERSKPVEVVIGVEDLFDARRAKRTNQLVLEIRDADVEPDVLHIHARKVGAEAGALESRAENRLLSGIAEAREPQAIPPRAELLEEAADAVRASEADNLDALCVKLDSPPLGQRFDRDLVACSFDDHDRAGIGPYDINGAPRPGSGFRPVAHSN